MRYFVGSFQLAVLYNFVRNWVIWVLWSLYEGNVSIRFPIKLCKLKLLITTFIYWFEFLEIKGIVVIKNYKKEYLKIEWQSRESFAKSSSSNLIPESRNLIKKNSQLGTFRTKNISICLYVNVLLFFALRHII